MIYASLFFILIVSCDFWSAFSVPDVSGMCVDYVPQNHIVVNASAYTKSKMEGTERGITSTGKFVSKGMIAGSCDFIKKYGYGKKFFVYVDYKDSIKFVGIYALEDRMNNRYKNYIDIYFDSYKEAKKFGRKKAFVVPL